MAYKQKKNPHTNLINEDGSIKKTRWNDAMIEQVYELTLLGYTNQQLADFYNMPLKTIENWQSFNKPFIIARRRGRSEADGKVAKSLFRRALGYDYEEKIEVTNAEGEITRVETKSLKVQPDVTACLKWLSMRQRGLWSETAKSEHTIKYAGGVDVNLIKDKIKNKKDYSIEDLKGALNVSLKNFEDPAEN